MFCRYGYAELLGRKGQGSRIYLRQFIDAAFHFGSAIGTAKVFHKAGEFYPSSSISVWALPVLPAVPMAMVFMPTGAAVPMSMVFLMVVSMPVPAGAVIPVFLAMMYGLYMVRIV